MNINFLKLGLIFLVTLGLFACAKQQPIESNNQAASVVSSDSDSDSGSSDSEVTEGNGSGSESSEVKSAEKSEEEKAAERAKAAEDAARAQRKIKNLAADELMLTKIYFKYNDDSLSAEAVDVIDLHADFMNEYPEAVLQLHGHTDERGTQEYNLSLGDRRGNSVANELIEKGIAADRIIVISFGENRPVDVNHDESAWARNRRVEFLYE